MQQGVIFQQKIWLFKDIFNTCGNKMDVAVHLIKIRMSSYSISQGINSPWFPWKLQKQYTGTHKHQSPANRKTGNILIFWKSSSILTAFLALVSIKIAAIDSANSLASFMGTSLWRRRTQLPKGSSTQNRIYISLNTIRVTEKINHQKKHKKDYI